MDHISIAKRVESLPPDPTKDLRAWMRDVPELRQLVIGAAIRGLCAVRSYWYKGSGAMVHEPDSASQMKAAAFVAAYSDGMPMQSTVNLNVDAGAKGLTMDDVLAQSPAAVEAIERTLARVKAKGRKPIELE